MSQNNKIPDFYPGDVVKLKSGGPRMTVSQFSHNVGYGNSGYFCFWFDNNTLCEATFPATVLSIVRGKHES